MRILTHHHRNDSKEISVALDLGKAKRNHIGQENHGWTEASDTQNLQETVKTKYQSCSQQRHLHSENSSANATSTTQVVLDP